MKRFGEKATREALKNGAIIRAWDFYTLNGGYRVIIDEAQAGYITSDLFFKLKKEGALVKDFWAYSYTDYKAAEAAEAAAEVEAPAAEESAAEAEKTAAEWAAESDRVHAATLAAFSAVIAEEEAAPAVEEEEAAEVEEESTPDYLNEPGGSYDLKVDTTGVWYSIDTNAGPGYIAASLEELENILQKIKQRGEHIEAAYRHDSRTNTRRRFIPETRQEKTDRENFNHCKRIAEELEAYADGRAYKCMECGAVIEWDALEESEHEDGEGWTAYTCPECEHEAREEEWEQLSLYDFFSDTYDIEYRCDGRREYRSVKIMVACGGPNIYIDTARRAVLLYWWTDRAEYPLLSSTAEAVDEWAEEYWNCY